VTSVCSGPPLCPSSGRLQVPLSTAAACGRSPRTARFARVDVGGNSTPACHPEVWGGDRRTSPYEGGATLPGHLVVQMRTLSHRGRLRPRGCSLTDYATAALPQDSETGEDTRRGQGLKRRLPCSVLPWFSRCHGAVPVPEIQPFNAKVPGGWGAGFQS
jgi:hypothetical protein